MGKDVRFTIKGKDEASGAVKGVQKNVVSLKGTMVDFNQGLEIVKKAWAAIKTGLEETVGQWMHNTIAAGDLARQLDITTEAASALIELSGDLGLDLGSLEMAFKKMAKEGIEPSVEGLIQVKHLLEAAPDAASRLALAQELLGKSGADLIPIFAQLSDEQLRSYVSNMSDAQIATEAEYQQALQLRVALDELQDAVSSVALTVGQDLAPVLIRVAERISVVNDLERQGIDTQRILSPETSKFSDVIHGLWGNLSKLAPVLVTLNWLWNRGAEAGAEASKQDERAAQELEHMAYVLNHTANPALDDRLKSTRSQLSTQQELNRINAKATTENDIIVAILEAEADGRWDVVDALRQQIIEQRNLNRERDAAIAKEKEWILFLQQSQKAGGGGGGERVTGGGGWGPWQKDALGREYRFNSTTGEYEKNYASGGVLNPKGWNLVGDPGPNQELVGPGGVVIPADLTKIILDAGFMNFTPHMSADPGETSGGGGGGGLAGSGWGSGDPGYHRGEEYSSSETGFWGRDREDRDRAERARQAQEDADKSPVNKRQANTMAAAIASALGTVIGEKSAQEKMIDELKNVAAEVRRLTNQLPVVLKDAVERR